MPTVSNKTPLGSLFGGSIASINYNFQVGSQASSATITVISENNKFLMPKFNEKISIPPFGVSMSVVERKTRKDGRYRVLQVELIESLSSVLDNELVLIYGEHTNIDYELNDDLYYVNNSVFVPKRYFPKGTVFNKSLKFPDLRDSYVKNHGNGINVIGTARAVYLDQTAENVTGNGVFKGEPTWITFQGGGIKENLSNYIPKFVYTPELSGSINVVYGFTLKNLFDLIKSKGLSFDDKSISLMSDENVFFSESGTMRDVLTACLSKIGRSFYVDPITQKLAVITNSDIARINSNLISRFSNFENVSGATQISLSESVADVEAVHFVAKGDLDFVDDNKKNGENKRERSRKQIFYKLKAESLTGDLREGDQELIKRVAPLLFATDQEDILNRYILALGVQYPTSNWGTLYSETEYRPGDFQAVKKTNPNQTEKTPDLPPWQRMIVEEGQAGEEKFGLFNPSLAVGARGVYRGPSPNKSQGKLPSEVNLYQNIKDFVQLWIGVYFSAPMSLKQIERRGYQERGKWSGGFDNTFKFVSMKGDSYITKYDEFQFLVRLLKRIGAKTNYKVKDIARKAYGKAIGDGDFFVVGFRESFFGSEIDLDDVFAAIARNFYYFETIKTTERFLIYTNDARNVLKRIEQICLDSFSEENKKVKDRLIIEFFAKNPDNDPDENSDGEEIHDIPRLFSIKNIPSNVKNFSKRSLVAVQNRYSDIKLFLENIGDLSPQFSGPLISTQIDYFRPPLRSDFDIEKGIDSVSVSYSDGGVTTSVSYSSKKFAQIDIGIGRDLLGSKSTPFLKNVRLPAFRKNLNGL